MRGVQRFVGGLAAASFAGAALADTIVVSSGPAVSYGGGPFNATISVETGLIGGNPAPFTPFSSGSVSIQTFCLETNEFVSFGPSYFVEYAASAAGGGSGGSIGGQDALSSATAWLYSQAIGSPGGLASVFGGSGFNIADSGHQRAMQEAIWMLEEENWEPGGPGTGSAYSVANQVAAWRDALIGQANANGTGSLFGVMVARLWTSRSFNSSTGLWQFDGAGQDLLVLIPLPPAAWAGIGTLAAVIGFSYMRRRSYQRA